MSEDLKNLGPISREWLGAVGIRSRAELEAVGSVEAYRLVRMHGFNATLNLLYALEAALRDEHWTNLAPEVKAHIKAAARKIKQER
jgi:DNA transformation protein and related proteins